VSSDSIETRQDTYQQVSVKITVSGSVETFDDDMKKKLIAQFSAATGIPIAQITLSVVAGSVLLQFTAVVLAANAATSQSSITTALSTPSVTQSALAPALPTGSLVTLAAVVTSAPYSGATYTAGKAKKLEDEMQEQEKLVLLRDAHEWKMQFLRRQSGAQGQKQVLPSKLQGEMQKFLAVRTGPARRALRGETPRACKLRSPRVFRSSLYVCGVQSCSQR